MKKILDLVLALCMVFALCACGSSSGDSDTPAASTVSLNVGTGGKQQATDRDCPDPVALAAFQQALPVGRFAFLDPGLTQFGVLERLDGRRRTRLLAHSQFPGDGDLAPTAPADRAVE